MKRYFAEFNRPRGDSIRRTEAALNRSGLKVSRVAHKTALMIERPTGIDWPTFKTAIRSELQSRRGSVLLFSESSKATYLCSNRGNKPGVFQRL